MQIDFSRYLTAVANLPWRDREAAEKTMARLRADNASQEEADAVMTGVIMSSYVGDETDDDRQAEPSA